MPSTSRRCHQRLVERDHVRTQAGRRLLIILIGYLLAKVVASVLDKVLERVGFDRAVERGGLKQALAKGKYDPSDIVAKLALLAPLPGPACSSPSGSLAARSATCSRA